MDLLKKLSQHQQVTVAMESTGTYGDPLRAELAVAALPVVRVSGNYHCGEAYRKAMGLNLKACFAYEGMMATPTTDAS